MPIYINTHAALSGIDNRYVELAESVRLSRWQFVRHVNATSGLGYMMFRAQNYGQTEVIFVGLLIYAIFGFVSNEVVYLGVDWHFRDVLAWFGALVLPTSVYLASEDFVDGVPSETAAQRLDELFDAALRFADAGGFCTSPPPLAAARSRG